MEQEVGRPQMETEQLPQALLTVTIAGSNYKLSRQGRLEELLGERSLDLILADFLDTGYLDQMLLTAPPRGEEERRAAEEIASLLGRGCRVSVRREGEGEGEVTEVPIRSLAEQKGLDLATRIERGKDAAPWYSLHLHLRPALAQTPAERFFDKRVESLKRELRPKIDPIDLRGLFRGNMQALGRALSSRKASPPHQSAENS